MKESVFCSARQLRNSFQLRLLAAIEKIQEKKRERKRKRKTKIEFRLKIARHNNRDLNYYMRFRFYDHVGQRGMVGNYVTSAGVIKCHKETDQPIRFYFFFLKMEKRA